MSLEITTNETRSSVEAITAIQTAAIKTVAPAAREMTVWDHIDPFVVPLSFLTAVISTVFVMANGVPINEGAVAVIAPTALGCMAWAVHYFRTND